jgi:hypothetical protein
VISDESSIDRNFFFAETRVEATESEDSLAWRRDDFTRIFAQLSGAGSIDQASGKPE